MGEDRDKKIKQIKNMGQTTWFRSTQCYPTTITQLKLMISIVDKFHIFDNFCLDSVIDMSSTKLDILYAVLRITNKLFNGYSDYVVNKIFCDRLREIFVCTKLSHYDMFFDQLSQDIDYFVCNGIKFRNLHMPIVKNAFIKYLDKIFNKPFYLSTMRKLSYRVDIDFYKKHNIMLESIIIEYIHYTESILSETYDTMKLFLEIIFSDCSADSVASIHECLEKHIDLADLINEYCMELDIYVEQNIYLDNVDKVDKVDKIDYTYLDKDIVLSHMSPHKSSHKSSHKSPHKSHTVQN